MDNYKEVIERYRDADLDSLTEEEYRELKAAEMADMQYYVDGITASKVPEVMYRIGRPITDLKMMMETGVEAFGDKNARRWLLDVDAKITGTQIEQDAINDYLKNSVSAFVKGNDVAIPLYQGMSMTRAPSDYNGGESELDVVQIRAEAFKTVANCLRIPVSFLEGNVNNFETVFESMLSFFIDPIAKSMEDEITAKSMTAMQWRHGSDARVDTTHIRHVDLFAVADKAEKLVGAMIDTPNEIREFTGQDRVEDKPEMDEYQMTKNHERADGGENNDDSAGTDAADGGDQGTQG